MPPLRLGDELLSPTPERPLVMAIVNASPDSFSDGGRYRGLDAQVARAHALSEAGAAIVDVGGESGVTHRPAVGVEEELARVAPLVARLAADGITVSVDTWKGAVAEGALEAGAAMINDVSGLRDPELAAACARAGAGLVVTHTRAAPKSKEFPHYDDLMGDVIGFLSERVATALAGGVGVDQIVVDPGIDLAKTPAQSVEVIRRLGELRALEHPILMACSRKDFVGAVTGRSPRRRLAGTLAAIAAGLDAGAAILRVHDVAEVVDYLKVRAALGGTQTVAEDLHLAQHLRREGACA